MKIKAEDQSWRCGSAISPQYARGGTVATGEPAISASERRRFSDQYARGRARASVEKQSMKIKAEDQSWRCGSAISPQYARGDGSHR